MNRYRLELVSEAEALQSKRFADATIFQTAAWLSHLRETQGGKIVHARVLDNGTDVGRFVGMVISRMGLRILGSPFAGWNSMYMGFNLEPGADRASALAALPRFAFRTLHCAHVEVMDRRLTESDHLRAEFRTVGFWGFEVDLTRDHSSLLAAMSPSCRWSIRKAAREGVVVEVAGPDSFVDDYYPQLKDVFAKQRLVPTYGSSRVESLIQNLHPTGNLLLATARDRNGTPIATGIFPAFNGTMYFWGGASWREHQHNQPNEALIWFAMQQWKAKGIRAFDMGGPSVYKRKYGGVPISVPWGRRSSIPGLDALRSAARGAFYLKQRASGRLRHRQHKKLTESSERESSVKLLRNDRLGERPPGDA